VESPVLSFEACIRAARAIFREVRTDLESADATWVGERQFPQQDTAILFVVRRREQVEVSLTVESLLDSRIFARCGPIADVYHLGEEMPLGAVLLRARLSDAAALVIAVDAFGALEVTLASTRPT